MIEFWYDNGRFSVEDNLFYEDNKRMGFNEDDYKDEIKERNNNHKAVVDKLTELQELLIGYKRVDRDIRRENQQLRNYINTLGLGIQKILHSIRDDRDAQAMIVCVELLKKLEEEELIGI